MRISRGDMSTSGRRVLARLSGARWPGEHSLDIFPCLACTWMNLSSIASQFAMQNRPNATQKSP